MKVCRARQVVKTQTFLSLAQSTDLGPWVMARGLCPAAVIRSSRGEGGLRALLTNMLRSVAWLLTSTEPIAPSLTTLRIPRIIGL